MTKHRIDNKGREYYRQRDKEYKTALRPVIFYSDPERKPLEYRKKAQKEISELADDTLIQIKDTNPTNRLRYYAKKELRRRKKVRKICQ